MAMEIYEPLLDACAETGNIDYAQWPAILPALLERLTSIAHNDFPIPRPYPIINPVLPSQRAPEADQFPASLPSNTPNTPRTLPPVPPFPGSNTSRIPDSQPQDGEGEGSKDSEGSTKEQLPAEVIQVLEQCIDTLRTTFPEKPPHTIQRLSELVLYPRRYYRTLPAWLRALDRVVSVSSGADVFPLSDLPPNLGAASVNGILNGAEGGGILFGASQSSNDTRNGYDKDSLGSDESLGGALLTPIPWLKDSDLSSASSSGSLSNSSKVESWQEATENPDDPETDGEMLPLVEDVMATTAAHAEAIAAVAQEHNGHDVPAREDGAVTQGELIRMEQEAGVVPVPHEELRTGDEGVGLDLQDEGDNIPHARGPDVVGTVDMGKVAGQEQELRISSPPQERLYNIDANDAQEVLSGGTTANKSDGAETDALPGGFVKIDKEDVQGPGSDDGDIVLVDADGATEDAAADKKADGSGVNIGADAADTSST